MDDGLDEKLVLGGQLSRNSGDLLGERNEGVLELDERETTEFSSIVVLLGFLELFNGFTDDDSDGSVFFRFSLVDFF